MGWGLTRAKTQIMHYDSIDTSIIANVAEFPDSIVTRTATMFRMSRQSVLKRVRRLIGTGVLEAEGNTNARRYSLRRVQDVFAYEISSTSAEDIIWQNDVAPLLTTLPKHVLAICQYGLTEMVNNVLDHSASERMRVEVELTAASCDLRIMDFGVGIFHKIATELGLEDERHSILELAKGKLTMDPTRHSGEGIFFTSRMADSFSILSRSLYFRHDAGFGDWLIEDAKNPIEGTHVRFSVSVSSRRTVKGVFDEFSTDGEDYRFSKTRVPVSLAQYGDGNLVSRSQAKRVLARCDKFAEVFLDFNGVSTIGQAFADEIFCVFAFAHPNIELTWINASDDVRHMIERAKSRLRERMLST